MEKEEIKKAIIEWASKQKKTKFYFKDMQKAVPDVKLKELKKVVTELVQDEVLDLFSTGSTSLYGLKGRGLTEAQTLGKEEEKK
ncbi:MAG TPA: sulfite reductase [Syntrophaceae bacterium]|nr:sulfite reductase [Syntrophaceae bacterium]